MVEYVVDPTETFIETETTANNIQNKIANEQFIPIFGVDCSLLKHPMNSDENSVFRPTTNHSNHQRRKKAHNTRYARIADEMKLLPGRRSKRMRRRNKKHQTKEV